MNDFEVAVKSGRTDDLKQILENVDSKVDINTVFGEPNWTALHYAANLGYTDCIEVLIKYGANQHARSKFGFTPLRIAVDETGKPSTKSIAILLASGSDPNSRDNNGHTALQSAAEYGNAEVVENLMAFGADPTIADNKARIPYDLALNDEIRAIFNAGSGTKAAKPRK